MNFIEDNWIQTEVHAPNRTSWAAIRDGVVLHWEELEGNDPAGARAFEVGLRWAESNYPGITFHWRHRRGSTL